jgi:hypothetical protein
MCSARRRRAKLLCGSSGRTEDMGIYSVFGWRGCPRKCGPGNGLVSEKDETVDEVANFDWKSWESLGWTWLRR